eukprot:935968-Pelagomonas_calceolata.AAC.3
MCSTLAADTEATKQGKPGESSSTTIVAIFSKDSSMVFVGQMRGLISVVDASSLRFLDIVKVGSHFVSGGTAKFGSDARPHIGGGCIQPRILGYRQGGFSLCFRRHCKVWVRCEASYRWWMHPASDLWISSRWVLLTWKENSTQ